MAVDKKFLRLQIVAQIDRCAALAYGAGHHFAQHGEHAPASMQSKAEADARLIHLIENYAALGVKDRWCTHCGCGNDAAGYVHAPLCQRPDRPDATSPPAHEVPADAGGKESEQ